MKLLIAIVLFHFCRLSITATLENRDVSLNSSENKVTNFEKFTGPNERPRPDQKSLLIVFDTTGSMSDDLEEMIWGAKDIVTSFSKLDNDPIFNYILSLFNDPYVDDPFITTDSDQLLIKLQAVTVNGGGDCPELAMEGLINALDKALPNSPAFLFSDASAKDYVLFDRVAELMQRKQSTVNFLLTGDCDNTNSPEFKVYEKISRISGGLVLNMARNNVRDVLVAMSVSLESDFVALQSIDSLDAGSSVIELELDETVKRLSVSLSGRNAKLDIKDSEKNVVTSEEHFTSDNIQIMTFDVTDRYYTIEASAESAFSMRVGGISVLGFDFGFSRQQVSTQAETYIRPISNQQNVLSIFVSDLSLISNLTSILIFPASEFEDFDESTFELKFANGFYSTDLFTVPNGMFRIRVFGSDSAGNLIDRVISTGIESVSTIIPEVEIDYDSLSVEAYSIVSLNCIVKSLTPVEVVWKFEDKILAEQTSDQSSNLPLAINNFQSKNVGSYSCSATNDVGVASDQIVLSLKPSCNAECPLDTNDIVLIPSYRDCSLYYECIRGIQYSRQCPDGTLFDTTTAACGDPSTALCGAKASCKA